jgi:Uma2 family endonuclease
MAVLVTDPFLEDRLRLERELSGADRYDEVWEGLYVMTPIPDVEHQQIVARFTAILQETVGWPELGDVFPGVNLTERKDDWRYDYRVPDVGVVLRGGKAEDCGTHLRGGADFLVEVTSPKDRTYEKIPFYTRLGVRELLVVDRSMWTLELYRWGEGELKRVGESSLDAPDVLPSEVVPLRFRLVPGTPRPNIEVTHVESGRSWLV